MKRKFYFALVTTITLAGCASKPYSVKLETTPPSASIICNNEDVGLTPKTIYYNKIELEGKEFLNTGCSAKWISGAKADFSSINLKENPKKAKLFIKRPYYFPSENKDWDFALEVSRLNLQRAILELEQARATQQSHNNLMNSINSLNQTIKTNTPKTAITNCYGSGRSINCITTGN